MSKWTTARFLFTFYLLFIYFLNKTHLVVESHHSSGEGTGDHFEKVRSLAGRGAACPVGRLLLINVAHQVGGEVLQVVGATLQAHEEDDRQPVEHVVHCGAGEGSTELLAVTHLEKINSFAAVT